MALSGASVVRILTHDGWARRLKANASGGKLTIAQTGVIPERCKANNLALRSKKEVDAPASADHPQAVGKRTKKSQDSEPGGPIREKMERLQSRQEMAWTNAQQRRGGKTIPLI